MTQTAPERTSTADLVSRYRAFLAGKAQLATSTGLDVDPAEVHPALKPHQRDATVWSVRGGRRAVFAAFGLGKGIIQQETCRLVLKKSGGERGLIFCPLGVRQEFARDARQVLGREAPEFIRDHREARTKGIYLTNYESVRDGKLDPRGFDVVSLDEAACFPAGTPVHTPTGSVPIEQIVVGDRIINASGIDRVTDAFRKEIKRAARIRLGDRTIVSSDDHRFFTTRGWVAAAELRPGDSIVEATEAMRLLRHGDRPEDLPGSTQTVLRSILLSEMAGEHAGRKSQRSQGRERPAQDERPHADQSRCTVASATTVRVVRSDDHPALFTGGAQAVLQPALCHHVADAPARDSGEGPQPRGRSEEGCEETGVAGVRLTGSRGGQGADRCDRCRSYSGVASQDGRHTSCAWRAPSLDRREGPGAHRAAAGALRGTRRSAVANRVPGPSQPATAGSSDLPLPRFGAAGTADCDRGRWVQSSQCDLEGPGCPQDRIPGLARVDSVEILEQGHPDLERYRDAGGRIYFYDLSAARHPSFSVAGLLVHNCLRGFGSTKTFRELMRLYEGSAAYRFVATATPSPNEYIELLAYAAFLDIMDVGQAKTRFFKRDSEKADRLTLHPHMEREFWLWVSSWALFLNRPSDLGHSDEGYALPPLDVRWHEVPSEAPADTEFDKDGRGRLFRNSAMGVQEAAAEKRTSLGARVTKMRELVDESPGDHFLLWHDLEAERHAIAAAVPGAVAVWGSQDLDERERRIIEFSDGESQYLATKPIIAGSGCNFQRHCHRAIFTGIGFKFADLIQAIHRIHRFLQTEPVRIDLIYTEAERDIRKRLERKWAAHTEMVARMGEIIREYGLSHEALSRSLARSSGVDRREAAGERWRLVNNDAVEETAAMPDASVDLIVTSIPFSTQYEYTPAYEDFGHSEDNAHFWAQMDFLTPELLRVLAPGRVAVIHVKDRIAPGGLTGLGFQTVQPFHAEAITHYTSHGFAYLGMRTVVTDVVRENNQTYRLGWTEQCKDGSRMGCGMPEYLLIFRKPPTDSSDGYADVPVVKDKASYSRSRWQTDAHGYWRSDGDRPIGPEDFEGLSHAKIFRLFRDHYTDGVYGHETHVAVGEALEAKRMLPTGFMLLQPPSWHPDVWTDVARMRTLNMLQERHGRQMHLCLARDSLVLTRGGYKPIQEVVIGEHVLTHRGRWRPVLAVQNTGVRPVVTVKAQGVPGLTLTPDHKLWTRAVRDIPWARSHSRKDATRAEPGWTEARNTVSSYVNLKLPETERPTITDPLHWWAVGRWLADGHWEAHGGVIISCGTHEINGLIAKLGRFGGNPAHRNGNTAQILLRDPGHDLRRTLKACGQYAYGKHLPPEAFTLPPEQAAALLDGYLSGDGHYRPERNRWLASSVSRELLLGVAMLAQRVHGAIASIYPGRPGGTDTILGRTVSTRQDWVLCFDIPDQARKNGLPFVLDDGAWKRVRSCKEAGDVETWNLRVAEDESYTAEGCIVKNCPLQFDIVERLIRLHSMEGETVYDPFAGLATVPYMAVKMGRRGLGVELNAQYFADGAAYCLAAEREMSAPTLFDLLGADAAS